MRLTDADAFKMEDFRHCLDCDSIIQVIKYAPTVDAVPVVRCKDCKYRSGLVGRPPFVFYICTCAEGLTGAVRDENYCSYGERKDGDGND